MCKNLDILPLKKMPNVVETPLLTLSLKTSLWIRLDNSTIVHLKWFQTIQTKKNPNLGKNSVILAMTGFHQLIYPKICSLVGEKHSFHQLTSKVQDELAGESTDFFKIKFLSRGESILHA